MAEKNIQMTQRNSANTGWDDLFPKTKAAQVTLIDSSGYFVASTVEDAMKELFQNVSSGKNAIAAAITGKGVTASGSETHASLATKIGSISQGRSASGSITAQNNFTINLGWEPKVVTFTFEGNNSNWSTTTGSALLAKIERYNNTNNFYKSKSFYGAYMGSNGYAIGSAGLSEITVTGFKFDIPILQSSGAKIEWYAEG